MPNYFSEEGNAWLADTLWRAAEPLRAVPLQVNWLIDEDWNIHAFEEVHRVLVADLKYPIILTPDGYICEGHHRVLKCLFLGQRTIHAVQLDEMPKPDYQITPRSNHDH